MTSLTCYKNKVKTSKDVHSVLVCPSVLHKQVLGPSTGVPKLLEQLVVVHKILLRDRPHLHVQSSPLAASAGCIGRQGSHLSKLYGFKVITQLLYVIYHQPIGNSSESAPGLLQKARQDRSG